MVYSKRVWVLFFVVVVIDKNAHLISRIGSTTLTCFVIAETVGVRIGIPRILRQSP